jgi:hypothetical protein
MISAGEIHVRRLVKRQRRQVWNTRANLTAVKSQCGDGTTLKQVRCTTSPNDFSTDVGHQQNGDSRHQVAGGRRRRLADGRSISSSSSSSKDTTHITTIDFALWRRIGRKAVAV